MAAATADRTHSPDRAQPAGREQTSAGGLARPKVVEDPCPKCGEGVRRGLVRCWNCGTFMREDTAAAYERMKRDAADTSFQPLPEVAAAPDRPATAAAKSLDEDDFELAGDFGEAAAAAPAAGAAPAGDADDDGGDFSLTGEFPAAPPADGDAADAETPGDDPAPPAESAGDAGDAAGDGGESAESPAGPPPEPDVPHSEATGGDALLDIALQDEAARGKRMPKGLRVTADAFYLRCPAGHPIKVARKHAGKVGRCPDPGCRLRYLVPDVPPEPDDSPAIDADFDTSETPTRDPLAVGPFAKWIDGPTLHLIEPDKLDKVKKTPGSLAKTGVPADLALSADTLLVLELKGKGGLLGLGGEKPAALREKAREHLSGDSPRITDLPCEHLVIAAENAAELSVEYPPAYEHESTFGDVPVFGEGRVVVKLPSLGGEKEPLRFLSMTLTEYRRLHAAVSQYGLADNFAAGCPAPLDDEPAEHTGHYTDAVVKELPRPDLYLADPALDVEVTGYRCGSCGLVVSEDGRKKEKLGGPKGKGLAKAKCPKCKGTFGENPLYGLKAKS